MSRGLECWRYLRRAASNGKSCPVRGGRFDALLVFRDHILTKIVIWCWQQRFAGEGAVALQNAPVAHPTLVSRD